MSGYAIGVGIYQNGKLVAFESKKLDQTPCRYRPRNELFTIIQALKPWCR